MIPTLQADPLPLRMDEQGAIRFHGSRVTLDIILEDFKSGVAVEAIAQRYDTVAAADVYAAISYYLRHPAEIDTYLSRRDEEAEELRRKVESSQPPVPTREELLARLAQRKGGHAARGD